MEMRGVLGHESRLVPYDSYKTLSHCLGTGVWTSYVIMRQLPQLPRRPVRAKSESDIQQDCFPLRGTPAGHAVGQ